jgi:hypothetical protein
MSKATRTVKRGNKFTPHADKYQSPFGPRPSLKQIAPGVQK